MSRFLVTTLWICTEQKVTVGVSEREGRRKNPRTTSSTMFHTCADSRIGLKGVLVAQGDEVRVVCVRNELVRDVGHVITGFL